MCHRRQPYVSGCGICVGWIPERFRRLPLVEADQGQAIPPGRTAGSRDADRQHETELA